MAKKRPSKGMRKHIRRMKAQQRAQQLVGESIVDINSLSQGLGYNSYCPHCYNERGNQKRIISQKGFQYEIMTCGKCNREYRPSRM